MRLFQQLSVNFSSTIFSIINMVGIAGGVYVPYIVGEILEASSDLVRQWNIVFYMCASLLLVSGVVFAAFVRSEPQDFDDVDDCDTKPIV